MLSRKLCSVLTPGKRTDKDDAYGKSIYWEKNKLSSADKRSFDAKIVFSFGGLVLGSRIPTFFLVLFGARAQE